MAERRGDYDEAHVRPEVTKAAHDAMWGCDYHFINSVGERMEGGSRYYLLGDTQEDAIGAAGWPIDIGAAVWKEPDERHPEPWLMMTRVTSITNTADVRGQVKMMPPRMVALSGARVWGGRTDPEITLCGLVGGKWCSIETDFVSGRGNAVWHRTGGNDNQDIHNTIMTSLAAALTERYSWHVAFGFSEDGPRLVLPTNPRGCLELFKNRDKALGEKRRAALKHWVNEHWRGLGNDDPEKDMTYVREHLRGQTHFIWNALECELMPSAFDLEKNEHFRMQAAEWRANRKHNAVRLRRRR